MIDELTASTPVQLLLLLGLLSVLPGILLVATSFTRILIVLGFMRNALGTPSMPPNQVLVGIALFLSLFVMAPTLKAVNDQAIKPYRAHKISEPRRSSAASSPCAPSCSSRRGSRTSRCSSTSPTRSAPKTRADVPTHVLIPAFIISELKTAFRSAS